MSELSVLFDGALAARRVPSTGADREVLVEALVKNAGRKRTVRAVGRSALVATAVAVVGLTSWAVLSNDRDPANPPIVTPSPLSPTPSVTVSPSPDPTASPQAPAIPTDPDSDWGALSDDIPDEAYPAMAPSRGDGFPEAHVMEPWVWEKTGPNWAVAIVTSGVDVEEPREAGDVYAYLVSPEGRHFELAEVPTGGTTMVRSWHEASRTARVSYYGTDDTTGESISKVGLLNLETGEVEESSVELSSGRSTGAYFVATSASQLEWWMFFDSQSTEFALASWSESEGWNRLDEMDLMGNWSISEESDVAFVIVGDPFAPEQRSLEGVFVDLVSGTHTEVSYPFADGTDYCYPEPVMGTTWVELGCFADELTGYVYLTPDGSLVEVETLFDPDPLIDFFVQDTWTDYSTGMTFVSEVESSRLFEVRSLSGKVLVSAPEDFPEAGLGLVAVDMVGTGLARITTFHGPVYLVDVDQERLVAMQAYYFDEGELPNGRSIVFYGEGFDRRDPFDYYDGLYYTERNP